MGLFGKKNCNICNSEIGFMSGKKVEDGIICKECNNKLSTWFEDRKNSTIDEIKSQLKSREENKENLNSFKTKYCFGEFGCLLIDEENKQFVALADTRDGLFKNTSTVSSLDQIKDKNPDIIKFSQIEDITIDINEMTREEKQMVNGEQVSYDPKHITYMESFTIRIKVDHPYIKSVYVPLEDGAIQIPCDEPRKLSTSKDKIVNWLLDRPEARIEKMEEFYNSNSFKDMLLRNPYELPDYSFGFKCSLKNKDAINKYRCMLLMANEIKNILLENN